MLVGCERNDVDQGYIKISWQNESNTKTASIRTISQSENVSTNNLPIKEHYYSTQSTELGYDRTKVFAFYYNENNELVPDAQFDFVFNAPAHTIEELNNNNITMIFSEAGEGNLIAKYNDLTATINFTVFPTLSIGWNKSMPNVKTTFNFKEGAANEHNNDIFYDELENRVYSVHGFALVTIQDMSQFLDEFGAFNNFEGLNYNIGYLWEKPFDHWDYFDKIFVIKTQNGYAKAYMTLSMKPHKDGDIWEFAHDYVE